MVCLNNGGFEDQELGGELATLAPSSNRKLSPGYKRRATFLILSFGNLVSSHKLLLLSKRGYISSTRTHRLMRLDLQSLFDESLSRRSSFYTSGRMSSTFGSFLEGTSAVKWSIQIWSYHSRSFLKKIVQTHRRHRVASTAVSSKKTHLGQACAARSLWSRMILSGSDQKDLAQQFYLHSSRIPGPRRIRAQGPARKILDTTWFMPFNLQTRDLRAGVWVPLYYSSGRISFFDFVIGRIFKFSPNLYILFCVVKYLAPLSQVLVSLKSTFSASEFKDLTWPAERV